MYMTNSTYECSHNHIISVLNSDTCHPADALVQNMSNMTLQVHSGCHECCKGVLCLPSMMSLQWVPGCHVAQWLIVSRCRKHKGHRTYNVVKQEEGVVLEHMMCASGQSP